MRHALAGQYLVNLDVKNSLDQMRYNLFEHTYGLDRRNRMTNTVNIQYFNINSRALFSNKYFDHHLLTQEIVD